MTGSGRMDDAAGARSGRVRMARCGNAACSKECAARPAGRGRFGRVMGGMVNDVGSQDGAAGARAVEEVGWHDVGTRRVRRGARRGLPGAGGLGAAMGGIVNDVGSQDGAAGARGGRGRMV